MPEIRCAIEYRADDTRRSPGHLYGVLLTYGERAADRPERFALGALSWPDDGIVLRRQHARSAPIMRIVPETRGKRACNRRGATRHGKRAGMRRRRCERGYSGA